MGRPLAVPFVSGRIVAWWRCAPSTFPRREGFEGPLHRVPIQSKWLWPDRKRGKPQGSHPHLDPEIVTIQFPSAYCLPAIFTTSFSFTPWVSTRTEVIHTRSSGTLLASTARLARLFRAR